MEQEAMRLLIVQNAINLLGSHYLNASDGGFPGLRDGLDKKDLKLVDNPDPENVMIRTVRFNGQSCAGRCNKVGGATFGKGDKTKAELLKKYCEEIKELLDKGIPPVGWKEFGPNLYPRSDVGVFDGKIVVGEDCSNVRHFDCISFVQWVLTITLRHKRYSSLFGKEYSHDIVQHEGWKKNDDTHKTPSAPGKRYFPPFPELMNGDILVRINWKENPKDETGEKYVNKKGENVKYAIGSKHIGFYVLGGRVIEASGAASGVILSDYKADKWTSMFRIHNRYLKFGY